jgi:predicted  nucleic acid-binding Zn-ribbon protein
MFFFVKDSDINKAQERAESLTAEQKMEIENDIYDILGANPAQDTPVVLEFESISIIAPGKYELDVVNLFKENHPLVYKLDEGKYMIDLAETFSKFRNARPEAFKDNGK